MFKHEICERNLRELDVVFTAGSTPHALPIKRLCSSQLLATHGIATHARARRRVRVVVQGLDSAFERAVYESKCYSRENIVESRGFKNLLRVGTSDQSDGNNCNDCIVDMKLFHDHVPVVPPLCHSGFTDVVRALTLRLEP